MLFNSLTYLAFMTVCVPLACLGPAWLRRVILLAGSLLFYAFWRVDFTVLVVFSALVDFVAARRMHVSTSARVRRAWLLTSLIINLGLLVFFKYAYFLADGTQGLMSLVGISTEFRIPSIILPLGISFYTFQTISYSIDVYRRHQDPEHDFSLFLTYVMFWPQLVAGPILRAHEVIPQLRSSRRPSTGEFVRGLEEIVQGMFKKVVLADSIAPIVDYGFAQSASGLGTFDVWVLCFAFGFQIYFDFSGYSQIAIGSARLLGLRFPDNFNWPYLATSVRDFWKRWHISLSSWIRDYLYLPILGYKVQDRSTGGLETVPTPKQRTESRRTIALFLTWFIMGLWHGAALTFALWGLLHALLVWGHRITVPMCRHLPMTVRALGGWCLTLPLIMLLWIPFRAESLSQTFALFARAFDPRYIRWRTLEANDYLLTALYLLGMLFVAAAVRMNRMNWMPAWLRVASMAIGNGVMLAGIFLFLRASRQFIYFQF